MRDASVRRDLILYDNVPGGAGYVRKVAQTFRVVLLTARQMLNGCQCEKSCYKCLRSYENQFEHSLLDKTLVQPYLDRLLALNNQEEQRPDLERTLNPGSSSMRQPV